jgi:hypothetical protein
MRPPPKICTISSADHDHCREDDEERSTSTTQQTACVASSKPGPPLRWLQLKVLVILYFVVCNEVECPDQQVRLVQLLLADNSGREDCLHVSIVRDRVIDVLTMPWVALQSRKNKCYGG